MSDPNYEVRHSGPVQGSVVGDNPVVTMIFHNGEKRTVEVLDLLRPIEETRMQAEDWKSLHEDFQRISLKLVWVRGTVTGEDLKLILRGLEDHWTFDCRDLIQRFVDLERLPERTVRREFVLASEKNGWLVRISSDASELDRIVGTCLEAEDLKAHLGDILAALLRIERISGQLLSFLDSRLQRVIKELDQAIAQARRRLTEPLSLTPPEATP